MECCSLTALGWLVIVYIGYRLLDRLYRYPYMTGRLRRHIFITGCDTGFGHEIAKRLDLIGYNVIAGCLTEKGETVLKKCCSHRLKTVPLNVADHESVQKAYQFVKETIPEGRGLWGLLNNAGIAGKGGPAEWLTKADYEEVFNVNLHGLIDVTVTFLPLLKQAKGRVVNTASVFGRFALVGGAPYTVSKYGVEAFSDSIRRQLRGFGVTIHLIEPGFHKTNITAGKNLESSIKSAWDRLSPELREEYGEEFLNKFVDQLAYNMVDKLASDRISDVVDAYEHALCSRFPRARYVVGKDAKFIFLPLQAMPEWLGDWIQNAIARDKPIPAVLKNK